MWFSKYAIRHMQQRRIPESDVAVVCAWPSTVIEGRHGAKTLYGQGPASGYRIRVTVSGNGIVKTAAFADWRK